MNKDNIEFRDMTSEQAERGNILFLKNALLKAQEELNGRASWLVPAIDICSQMILDIDSEVLSKGDVVIAGDEIIASIGVDDDLSIVPHAFVLRFRDKEHFIKAINEKKVRFNFLEKD